MGGSRLKIQGGVLAPECRALFEYWKKVQLSKPC
jgi:hypothetical protein